MAFRGPQPHRAVHGRTEHTCYIDGVGSGFVPLEVLAVRMISPLWRFLVRFATISLALFCLGVVAWVGLPSERLVALLIWFAAVASAALGAFLAWGLKRHGLR